MRVGFLSHAGASVYHFRASIIKALKARGDEVIILVPKDEYAKRLEELNCQIIFYELKRSSLNPLIIFANFIHLKNVLKSLKLDLLQTSAHKSNTFGILAATLAKIPHKFALVEGLGSFYIDTSFKSALVRLNINFLYKLAFKFATKFIFVNESNAAFMRALGLKEEKICVIKSVGINLKKFFPLPIPKEQKIAFLKEYQMPDKPIVLMVARALWHKGVREFYEAASILKERANFIFVGGCDDNISSASVEFLQSGVVFYLGARSDVVNIIRLCDVFVLPSYKEGFPVTIMEAKACAKACVVSDCEGCVEAISNAYDGLWAKTGDAIDLSEKIALLLNDEKLRANLAQNAAKEALKYDEEEIARKYLKLYDESMKNV
ncbi:N,N'-diacetylbacillosaminyl-diphospho-undecaprenol alpha-1,3-N-acetylgalactosaminyltransferase [Campylobacter upsaliensis]|uniref:N, N'-diacetylbacillosaminyl-diphospho-undecaprenol alpha-1,3-N-acetylgalactosaminyltransferase n=1 Tax=Campylobacter upsaliensis TaxID=28080 RepID=UPI0012C91FC8|nr:N,N'-diacetylbacillosaminyl-diphospho-undecaprenol alpha-1,3-N-acetylgalactosaminyltransferase [Campylobacter upsaliensis]MBT0743355.1 N,N'-diacetylbacillosaminyl-diphospho-undecaprenol alpha-1,3-N-acetylgalactosaminyltransferase [Campylobacter upsaliensis]